MAAVGVEERNVALLSWFVIRARRVEEHSLLADKADLVRWAEGTMHLSGVEGEPTATLRWDLPPEEALDSLAARCRPFIVQSDPVYWATATGALGYYLRDHQTDPLTASLEALRAGWRRVDKSNPGHLAFLSRASGGAGDELGEVITDIALAYEWLYGDLVHADADAAVRVGAHDLNDRYRAGAILISNVALRVVATLNLVRALRDRGLLELPDEPFTQAVTANPGAALTVRNVAHLAVGAPTDELEAELDAQRAAGQQLSIGDLLPSPVSPPPTGVGSPRSPESS